MPTRIVAFLANRPSGDIEQAWRVFAANAEDRESILAYYLFDKPCATGQMLLRTFSECLRQRIVWELPYRLPMDNALRQPAEIDHIRRVLARYRPQTVLSFGVPEVEPLCTARLISGPHPASRRIDTLQRLERMAQMAREPNLIEYASGDGRRTNRMPSPAQIAEMCQQIRAGWSEEETMSRLV